MRSPRSTGLSALLAVFLVIPAWATPAPPTTPSIADQAHEPFFDDSATSEGRRLERFGLMLGSSPAALEERVRIAFRERLSAPPDDYLHVSLAARHGAGSGLPAPSGLRVLDADLYYVGGESLVQANLLVRSEGSAAEGLDRLVALFGAPAFEALLPGAIELTIGWQLEEGFVLATFTDMAVFQLSAFPDVPDDLMAGSSALLFEALREYVEGLESGAPRSDVERELRQTLAFIGEARNALKVR